MRLEPLSSLHAAAPGAGGHTPRPPRPACNQPGTDHRKAAEACAQDVGVLAAEICESYVMFNRHLAPWDSGISLKWHCGGNKRVFVTKLLPSLSLLNIDWIWKNSFSTGGRVLYLRCLGGGFIFHLLVLPLDPRFWASQRRRNRGEFFSLAYWHLKWGSWIIGSFLEWGRMHQKVQQAYTARREEIFYTETKKCMSLPQFGYKPLKTTPANSHLSDTQTLIKQGVSVQK